MTRSWEREQVLESATMPVATALEVAVQLHRRGNLENAEAIYRGILAEIPDHPDAMHFLGVLCHQLGRGAESVRLIRRAIEVAPGHPDMHNNLGNVLKEQGDLGAASIEYERVVALRPEHADGYNNLGVLRKAQGRHDEAALAYCRAIELAPDHADAHLNLGNLLRRLGKVDEAVAACRKAIALKPEQGAAYENLATALHRAGRTREAVDELRKWLSFSPDNAIARHMLAAYTGEAAPERAPVRYVKELFDRFAGSFDECLQSLGYRAPQLVADAVARCLPTPARHLRVLDAGCGTGLCGPLLRPYARHLIGVDLSSAMLAKARGRRVYDELAAEDLTGFLESSRDAFELVVSADTLVYFGDLWPVCRAVHGALHPEGKFVFTLELASVDEVSQGYFLNEHGRYSHSEDYVRQVLAGCGLRLLSLEVDVLRQEGGAPVAGLVVVTDANQVGRG